MQEEPPNATVADALAAALLRHGITEVFGQSLPSAFFLAAQRRGIRQITYRTENAGGAMADGFARIRHRVGVVAAQNGPAATLLVPPLAEAMKVSTPILALVQDVPVAARDRNAFQEFDHVALFQGCTKWVRQLNDPARVDDYVDMALTAATTGRPGPVVLLLPKDILAASVPGPAGLPGGPRRETLGAYPLDRLRPDPRAVTEAARLIATAARPLVVAGGGVHLSDAAAEMATLQEFAALPVATTNMGKGAVSERHELSVGVIGNYMGRNSATRHHRELVRDADLVVFVGARTNENATDSWNLFPAGATYIHIDIDGGEIGRNYESVRVAGDARMVLRDLVEALGRTDLTRRHAARPAVVAAIAAARDAYRQEVGPVVNAATRPVRPERVMAELDALLGDDAIVVADASYSTIWSGNYLRARRAGQRFLSPRGLAGLGWGLPLALGAKAASPQSTVVCIAGDGGFAHVWSEVETSVRADLPVVLLVLNNSILGFQKHSELYQFGDHTSAIDLGPVDHAAIAAACGADAVRVDDPAQLPDVLAKALAGPRTTVVDILTDPDAYPPITLWDGHADRIAGTPDR